MYEVTVDFHDRTIPVSKRFDTLTDLALYLERIPSMIGFEINRELSVRVRTVNYAKTHPTLPFNILH